MFRNELVRVADRAGERKAHVGEVKRLRDKPIVIEFASDGAKIEVAARAEHGALMTGPLTAHATRAPPTAAAV